ncbi:MAG: hypothetical protein AAF813_00740 [Pseudomonadota bacterium]
MPENDANDRPPGDADGDADVGDSGAWSDIDIAIFSKAERRVLEAALLDETFTAGDLIDLTGYNENYIRGLIKKINDKATGLIVELAPGAQTGTGPGRKPKLRRVDAARADGLRDAIERLEERNNEEAAVIESVPALDYAANLLQEVISSTASAVEKRQLVDRAHALIGQAEKGAAWLQSATAPVSETFTQKLAEVRTQIEKIELDNDRQIRPVGGNIDTTLSDPTSPGSYGLIPDLVQQICNAFPKSGQARTGEFVAALIGCAEDEAQDDERRMIRRNWRDREFSFNIGLAASAAVRNAARIDTFLPLSSRLMKSIDSYTLSPNDEFASMLDEAAQTPGLNDDLKLQVHGTAISLRERGSLSGEDEAMPDLLPIGGSLEELRRQAVS